jgi:ABC-type oligopeptide transport system substrate-binding subunit
MKISKNVRLMAMVVLIVTLSLSLLTGGANSATKPSTSNKTLSIALASNIATMDPKISNDRYSSNIPLYL